MTLEIIPWDSAEYLKTEEDIRLCLDARLEDADESIDAIIYSFSIIARARNIGQVTRESDLTREDCNQAPSPEGNPTLTTVAKLSKALGFKLTVQTIGQLNKEIIFCAI